MAAGTAGGISGPWISVVAAAASEGSDDGGGGGGGMLTSTLAALGAPSGCVDDNMS